MTDSEKYPWLRIFIYISLCPALVGCFTIFYAAPSFYYANENKESILVVLPIFFFFMLIMSVVVSSTMYAPPMMLLAIIVIFFKLRRISAHLILISAIGGVAALGWCRLVIFIDGSNKAAYRDLLMNFNLPAMTDGVVFLFGAVCPAVAAWFALPKLVR